VKALLDSGTIGMFMNRKIATSVTNFIWLYLYQFFNDSHGLSSHRKSLKRSFD